VSRTGPSLEEGKRSPGRVFAEESYPKGSRGECDKLETNHSWSKLGKEERKINCRETSLSLTLPPTKIFVVGGGGGCVLGDLWVGVVLVWGGGCFGACFGGEEGVWVFL